MASDITVYLKLNARPNGGYNGQGSPDDNYTAYFGPNIIMGTGKMATIGKMVKHLRTMQKRGLDVTKLKVSVPDAFKAYDRCVIPTSVLAQDPAAPIDQTQLQLVSAQG